MLLLHWVRKNYADADAAAEMPFVHRNHADNRMSARDAPG